MELSISVQIGHWATYLILGEIIMFANMFSVYGLLSYCLRNRIDVQSAWAEEFGWVSTDQIEGIYEGIYSEIGILFSL